MSRLTPEEQKAVSKRQGEVNRRLRELGIDMGAAWWEQVEGLLVHHDAALSVLKRVSEYPYVFEPDLQVEMVAMLYPDTGG